MILFNLTLREFELELILFITDKNRFNIKTNYKKTFQKYSLNIFNDIMTVYPFAQIQYLNKFLRFQTNYLTYLMNIFYLVLKYISAVDS